MSSLLQIAALGQEIGLGRGRVPFPTAVQPRTPSVSLPTPSSSRAEPPPAPVTKSPHVKSGRTPNPFEPMQRLAGILDEEAGLAQMTTERPVVSWKARREIAIPSYKQKFIRGVGDVDTLTPGDYHISGTQVQLRTLPSAKSAVKGVLTNGENVYVFGDLETDPEFMLGPNNEAVPNDGDDPGIIYARVGTQHNGAGWVAAYFLASGPGTQVQPQPQPQPSPTPTPAPTPTAAKKSALVPVLVGGSIGAAVLLGGALIYRAAKKSRRTPTRRMPAYA